MERRASIVALVLALATACAPTGPCTAAELSAALADARPGELVRVGSCRIEGSFVVPAGVSVTGGDGTVLASIAGGAPVLDVDASASSTITHLAIEVAHGGVGLRAGAATPGHLTIEDSQVRVTHGIGIGVTAVPTDVRRVDLAGPITATTPAMTPAQTGTFGLVARDLGSAALSLEDVHVAGFATAGVSVGGGTLVWQGRASGADVERGRGVGIAMFGTHADLRSVEVAGMFGSLGLPGVGIAIGGSADGEGSLTTTDVVVGDGEGYGLFSDGASLTLATTTFHDLGLAGIRAQGGSLTATDLTCQRNHGAGLLAIDVDAVSVERGLFDAQAMGTLTSGIGSVPIGDGLEVVRDAMVSSAPPLDVRLVDVELTANARAGVLIDAAGGAVTQIVLERVRASSDGASALGAVSQNPTLPSGWDAMVTREGTALANDAAFAGSIPTVGIMMPPGLVATPPSL